MKSVDSFQEEDVAVQMGPLIDCVFLLLIFFMVVALTKKSQWEYQGQLNTAYITAEAEEERPEEIVLSVDSHGALRIDGEDGKLDAAALGSYLQARADEVSGRPVLITTDENATLGMVMPVLDACKQFGLNAFHVRLRRNRSFQP